MSGLMAEPTPSGGSDGRDETDRRSPTAHGDREGRRRDVLAAAAAILAESGWEHLSIRGVAERAGVSSGAVYQWFSGKDEIFHELYRARLGEGFALLDEVGASVTLDDFVRGMLDWTITLWSTLGRFECALSGAGAELNAAFAGPEAEATRSRATAMLVAAGAREGLLLDDGPHTIPWLFAACTGVAECITTLGLNRDEAQRAEFVDYSAGAIRSSLVSTEKHC